MKLVVACGLALSVLIGGCSSSDDTTTTPTPGVGADAGPPQCSADVAPPETRQVSCAVTLSTPGLQQPASKHVLAGTSVTYCTNPPTSGPHYAIWADFKEYTAEIPWENLVHSEEHGGVLLLYNCPTGCPDVVEALRAVRDRAAVDRMCESQGRPGVKRIIIAPSSKIPTKVAAAAWGASYTADCADGPTLDEFVATKSKNPPEDLCYAGQATF